MIDHLLRRARIASVIERAKERFGVDTRPNERWLRRLRFETILDIGANTGQFADEARKLSAHAMIYSFEPLRDCFEQLRDGHAHDPLFKAFHLALGEEPGEVVMHKNEYSQSSSLLPMAELHKRAFPETRNVALEKVRVARLDDVVIDLTMKRPVLVKIDVQGFEAKVIAGAKKALEQADAMIVETSVEPLYEGQPLFDDVYRMLFDMGFRYRGNYNQLLSPDDGRVLQADAFFTRA